MKSLPTDPFAFQARVMSALCDDILDPAARRDGTFPRMAALHEVSKQSCRRFSLMPETGFTTRAAAVAKFLSFRRPPMATKLKSVGDELQAIDADSKRTGGNS